MSPCFLLPDDAPPAGLPLCRVWRENTAKLGARFCTSRDKCLLRTRRSLNSGLQGADVPAQSCRQVDRNRQRRTRRGPGLACERTGRSGVRRTGATSRTSVSGSSQDISGSGCLRRCVGWLVRRVGGVGGGVAGRPDFCGRIDWDVHQAGRRWPLTNHDLLRICRRRRGNGCRARCGVECAPLVRVWVQNERWHPTIGIDDRV